MIDHQNIATALEKKKKRIEKLMGKASLVWDMVMCTSMTSSCGEFQTLSSSVEVLWCWFWLHFLHAFLFQDGVMRKGKRSVLASSLGRTTFGSGQSWRTPRRSGDRCCFWGGMSDRRWSIRSKSVSVGCRLLKQNKSTCICLSFLITEKVSLCCEIVHIWLSPSFPFSVPVPLPRRPFGKNPFLC